MEEITLPTHSKIYYRARVIKTVYVVLVEYWNKKEKPERASHKYVQTI